MNFIFWSSDNEEDGRDSQVSAWLSALDPGHGDAAYWVKFHGSAMEKGRFELARRRREADLSVTGLVSSWSRALVPAALAAAAAAGLVLAETSAPTATEYDLLVEDVLTMGMAEPIPSVVDDDDENLGLFLASEIY